MSQSQPSRLPLRLAIPMLICLHIGGCLAEESPLETGTDQNPEQELPPPYGSNAASCVLSEGCIPGQFREVKQLILSLADIPAGNDWIAMEVETATAVDLTAVLEEVLTMPGSDLPKCGVLWSASNRLLFAGEPFGLRIGASPALGEPIDQHDLTGAPSTVVIEGWKTTLGNESRLLVFGYGEAAAWLATGSNFTAKIQFTAPVKVRPVATGQMHCLSDPAQAAHETYVEAGGVVSSIRQGRHAFDVRGEGQGMLVIRGNQIVDAVLRGPDGWLREFKSISDDESATIFDVLPSGRYELEVNEATSIRDSAGFLVAYLDLPAALSQELGPWPE